MTQAKQTEPPSLFRPPLFMIGQDDRGHWVARDLNGICGGWFVSREAAMRYVRSENGHRPQAVVMVSGVLDLDMTHKPAVPQREFAAPLRRIA